MAIHEDRFGGIRASLCISGFEEEPERMAHLLGLVGADLRTKGKFRVTVTGRPTKKTYKESAVCINSRVGSSGSFDEVVGDVLSQVAGSAEAIRALPPSIGRELYCTIIPDDGVPLIKVTAEMMASMCSLGIHLIVDVIEIGAAK